MEVVLYPALALIITAVLNKVMIPALRKVKLGQKILEIGPNWHKCKEGTPTMGGATFMIPFAIAMLVLALTKPEIDKRLYLVFGLAMISGLTGFIDDYVKLFKKRNEGLTPLQKLVLQFAAAGAFLAIDALVFGRGTVIELFGNSVDAGVWYYIVSLPLIVYLINCSNLTDGIDGLEISVSGVMIAFWIMIAIALGAVDTPDTLLLLAAFGGAVGFFIFNHHPAKIFMGDTGSLFLGGLVVGFAYFYKFEIALPFVCLIWIIEGVSVVLQVLYFKATKKRLFKMAPIHHHFEKCGFSENKIVILASLTTAVGCGVLTLLCINTIF